MKYNSVYKGDHVQWHSESRYFDFAKKKSKYLVTVSLHMISLMN